MIKEKSSSIFKKFKNIGCGCLLILLLLIILGSIFSGIIVKKLISSAIQQKTGVNVNIDNINQGKLTYTDPKTGATLNIGGNSVPTDFPKDFPIYPGSTVTSSLSGGDFWLTLTTKDTLEKVSSYYETNLKVSGWKTNSASGTGGSSWAISKNDLTGYVTISNSENITSILIVLGKSKN